MAAIGLQLSDLFDEPLAHRVPPSRSRIPARDLLELLEREVDVVVILLGECLEHKMPLTELAWERLAQASARIGRARTHAYGC
jgi:hypothetical protein